MHMTGNCDVPHSKPVQRTVECIAQAEAEARRVRAEVAHDVSARCLIALDLAVRRAAWAIARTVGRGVKR